MQMYIHVEKHQKKKDTNDQLTALDKKMQKPKVLSSRNSQQPQSDDDDGVDDDET